MIRKLQHAVIYVLDQDSAKAFYTEKLGFRVRYDGVVDGERWLTVLPPDDPDTDLVLMEPGPPRFDEDDAAELKALVAKGVVGGSVFHTDDCRRTYEELTARGVVFLSEPSERPYGIEARFRDDSGNWFSLHQN
jgi:catechol 2,3-dioxygenase-like lactoylglutathione lyase family enzyme